MRGTLHGAGGTLTVSDGRHTAAIALFGNYIAGSLVIAADGHGGTLVTQALQSEQQALLAHPPHRCLGLGPRRAHAPQAVHSEPDRRRARACRGHARRRAQSSPLHRNNDADHRNTSAMRPVMTNHGFLS